MYINFQSLKRIESFLNCLCTKKELRTAPAALFFDVVCHGDMADNGVAFLAFVAQIFTEKLQRQNSKNVQTSYGKKNCKKESIQKSFHRHFCFIIFSPRKIADLFLQVLMISFTTLSGYHFHDVHQLRPLGRVGLVVAISVCRILYLVPFPCNFFACLIHGLVQSRS